MASKAVTFYTRMCYVTYSLYHSRRGSWVQTGSGEVLQMLAEIDFCSNVQHTIA